MSDLIRLGDVLNHIPVNSGLMRKRLTKMVAADPERYGAEKRRVQRKLARCVTAPRPSGLQWHLTREGADRLSQDYRTANSKSSRRS